MPRGFLLLHCTAKGLGAQPALESVRRAYLGGYCMACAGMSRCCAAGSLAGDGKECCTSTTRLLLEFQGRHWAGAEIVKMLLSSGPRILEEALHSKVGNFPEMPEFLAVPCC